MASIDPNNRAGFPLHIKPQESTDTAPQAAKTNEAAKGALKMPSSNRSSVVHPKYRISANRGTSFGGASVLFNRMLSSYHDFKQHPGKFISTTLAKITHKEVSSTPKGTTFSPELTRLMEETNKGPVDMLKWLEHDLSAANRQLKPSTWQERDQLVIRQSTDRRLIRELIGSKECKEFVKELASGLPTHTKSKSVNEFKNKLKEQLKNPILAELLLMGSEKSQVTECFSFLHAHQEVSSLLNHPGILDDRTLNLRAKSQLLEIPVTFFGDKAPQQLNVDASFIETHIDPMKKILSPDQRAIDSAKDTSVRLKKEEIKTIEQSLDATDIEVCKMLIDNRIIERIIQNME